MMIHEIGAAIYQLELEIKPPGKFKVRKRFYMMLLYKNKGAHQSSWGICFNQSTDGKADPPRGKPGAHRSSNMTKHRNLNDYHYSIPLLTGTVYNFPELFLDNSKSLEAHFPFCTMMAIREPWMEFFTGASSFQILYCEMRTGPDTSADLLL